MWDSNPAQAGPGPTPFRRRSVEEKVMIVEGSKRVND